MPTPPPRVLPIPSWSDFGQMLINIAVVIGQLELFMVAFCYLGGFLFFFKGMYKLKEYGELRTMMATRTSILRPLVLFAIAASLTFLPTTVTISLNTFFAGPGIPGYGWGGDGSHYREAWRAFWRIIQFIGLVAFVRGFFILAQLGGEQFPPGAFGKAMSHIVGGVFAMNIVVTAKILLGTIGVRGIVPY